MPSLHFGWAMFVAYAACISFRSRWRYLVMLHPLFTLLSIVLTANHYIIDALVAAVLVFVALGRDAGQVLWTRLRAAAAGLAGRSKPRPDRRFRHRIPRPEARVAPRRR